MDGRPTPALARTFTMRATCPYCWPHPSRLFQDERHRRRCCTEGRVSPVPKPWVDESGRVLVYADQEMERLTAAGRDSLETVGAQLPAVPMESMVRLGELAEEILLEAEAFGADAIVLAAGRPSWFKRVTGGGIGQWLLRKAPVPVVLVRST